MVPLTRICRVTSRALAGAVYESDLMVAFVEGTNTYLYHSSNLGKTWRRSFIVPEAPLTDDAIEIHYSAKGWMLMILNGKIYRSLNFGCSNKVVPCTWEEIGCGNAMVPCCYSPAVPYVVDIPAGAYYDCGSGTNTANVVIDDVTANDVLVGQALCDVTACGADVCAFDLTTITIGDVTDSTGAVTVEATASVNILTGEITFVPATPGTTEGTFCVTYTLEDDCGNVYEADACATFIGACPPIGELGVVC